MKKAEVKIGGKYYANVTGKKVEIQIDSEKPSGGWNATNLATGKKIQVKSAQRLHGEVGKGKSVTKTQSDSQAQPPNDADPDIVPLKPKRSAKKTEGQEPKRLSALAAAHKVLCEATEPLNVQQMIEAMTAKGYWTSPGGKTPHATLYSAILRELAKGEASRFVKTDRGRFVAANATAEVTQ
ncbi:MAG: HTH domain-containing protein [Exiguobacterium acetylicum]|jgi:hypothetical protein